jgi:hypothetical protein
MTKTFFPVAVLLGIAFVLTGCTANSVTTSEPSLTTQVPGEDQVWVPEPPANAATFQAAPQLRIQPPLENKVRLGVYHAESFPPQLFAHIYNDSDYDITAGEPFQIEVWDGTIWRTVPWREENTVFTDIGYPIPPGESTMIPTHWQAAIPLEPGLYRVRKSVFRDVDIPITPENHHEIVGEFVVQGPWE